MKKIIKRSAAAFLSALLTVTAMPAVSSAFQPETVSAASSELLAFPGAVGGGKYATGGRGGGAYNVTRALCKLESRKRA